VVQAVRQPLMTASDACMIGLSLSNFSLNSPWDPCVACRQRLLKENCCPTAAHQNVLVDA